MTTSDDNRTSDRELLSQVAEGQGDALRELTRRYGGLLLALARRVLRDQPDAEEVVADVLWQAWREAGSFNAERGSVVGWLAMITRSRAIDRFRAHQAMRRKPIDDAEGNEDIAPDPSEELFRGERRQLVRQAVNSLPQSERELLEMAYFGDLSQSEIALRSGVPLGTVKTRIRNAMTNLRRALESVVGPAARDK